MTTAKSSSLISGVLLSASRCVISSGAGSAFTHEDVGTATSSRWCEEKVVEPGLGCGRRGHRLPSATPV